MTVSGTGFLDTLRARQDGRLFPEDIFTSIFFNENVQILIKISLTFVPKAPINNIPALVQIMAWRRPGDKPLSEPMMVSLLMHICVTRPQWVNMIQITPKRYNFDLLSVYLHLFALTHWGRVTHICVGKLNIIVSDSGLSPGRRQAIIWTNAGILLIGPLGTNFSEILIRTETFSCKKMHLKMASAKWRPFCLGLNVLTHWPLGGVEVIWKV